MTASEAAQAAYPNQGDAAWVGNRIVDRERVAYDRGVADTEARLAVEPEQVADPSGDPYPWVWSGHSPFNRMRADTDKFRAGASDMLYLPRPEFAAPVVGADDREALAQAIPSLYLERDHDRWDIADAILAAGFSRSHLPVDVNTVKAEQRERDAVIAAAVAADYRDGEEWARERGHTGLGIDYSRKALGAEHVVAAIRAGGEHV